MSATPPALHPDAEAFVEYLGHGRGEALRATEFSRILGCPERSIRAAIEELRRGGVLVGSSSRTPAGYYLIETAEELEETAGHMRSRARAIFTTVSAMRRAAAARFGEAQASLFDMETETS